MNVVPVDERDSAWEDSSPRYRVYFFAGDGPGCHTSTFDVTDAEMLEVVQWAEHEAGLQRMFAIALVRDEVRVGGGEPERGLVWLLGADANDSGDTDALRVRQATMRSRRRHRRLPSEAKSGMTQTEANALAEAIYRASGYNTEVAPDGAHYCVNVIKGRDCYTLYGRSDWERVKEQLSVL
jgi:hypothetical protein